MDGNVSTGQVENTKTQIFCHVCVLPNTQPSASMRRTSTDPYTRIHHDHTRHSTRTRIVGSVRTVAVRPRKA